MALNTSPQYASDKRVPFAFGGSGSGRVIVPVKLSATEAETAATHIIYRPLKKSNVKNFSIWADDLDTDSTPTIVLDVGAGGDDFASGTPDVDEFIDGATSAQAGVASITNTTEGAAGTILTENDYVSLTIAVAADAAKGAAGTVYVAFDVQVID